MRSRNLPILELSCCFIEIPKCFTTSNLYDCNLLHEHVLQPDKYFWIFFWFEVKITYFTVWNSKGFLWARIPSQEHHQNPWIMNFIFYHADWAFVGTWKTWQWSRDPRRKGSSLHLRDAKFAVCWKKAHISMQTSQLWLCKDKLGNWRCLKSILSFDRPF